MKQKGLAPILIVLLITAAIGGYLLYSGKINLNKSQTIFPQKQIQQIQTIEVDETASWKTYTSEILSLSMKYPSDIKFDHKQTFPGKEYLRFENEDGYMTLETMGCDTSYSNPVLEDTVTIAGVTSKRYRITPSGGYNQIVANPKLKDGLCLNLTMGLQSASEKRTKALFDQILSTFKFLDQSQTEKEGENFIMFNGRKLMIKRVQEDESCQGFVGSQQTYYPKCDTGLKCQFKEGTIQDAPGTCVKE